MIYVDVSTTWNGEQFKRHVKGKTIRLLTKMAIEGKTKTQEIITEKGRIDSGAMRNTMIAGVNVAELYSFYGSPIKDPPYPVYQEMGTTTGIEPMYAFRGALDYLKEKYRHGSSV